MSGDAAASEGRKAAAAARSDAVAVSQLSSREREVLQLIAFGYTNSEIGERLSLSVRTVESHRANVQSKLGLQRRFELVRVALDSGLLG